jgi:hypothetical protein
MDEWIIAKGKFAGRLGYKEKPFCFKKWKKQLNAQQLQMARNAMKKLD